MANKKKESFSIKLEQYTFTPARKITINLKHIFVQGKKVQNISQINSVRLPPLSLSQSG